MQAAMDIWEITENTDVLLCFLSMVDKDLPVATANLRLCYALCALMTTFDTVVITRYHTLLPKTAVRAKFHLMGKFWTDTCPRYSYHTSSYDKPF